MIKNEYIITLTAKYMVETLQPVLCISLDGNYSIFGTLREVMAKNNIPTTIYRPDGFHERTVFIGDSPYGVYNVSDHWDYFSKKNFSAIHKKKAIKFLNSRINLSGYKPNHFDKKWVELIRSVKTEYKKTIAVFPNLTWDGAIKERDIIFESLDEWLFKTIEWSQENNVLLVIREHPQPMKIYSEQKNFSGPGSIVQLLNFVIRLKMLLVKLLRKFVLVSRLQIGSNIATSRLAI